MNYAKQYGLLIKKGLNRPKPLTYTEKHHIKPECMGGTNFKHNIVILTAREHYMAHWFLVNMYPKHHGLVWGLHMMTNTMKEQRNLNLSARDYEQVRILFSKHQSKRMIKHYKNPENRKKRKEISIELWKEPENRKKMSELKKEFYKTEQGQKYKEELSTIKKEYYKNPENLLRNRQQKTCISVEIDGVLFLSKKEASRKLNIPSTSLSRRLNSKTDKFKNYKYI